jgi:hypothetical protein
MSYEFILTDGSILTEVEPLESNGLGAQSVPRQILDVDFSDNSFILADDLSSRFVAGFSLDVITGPYFGTYVVDVGGSTYDGATNTTSIPVIAPIVIQPLSIVDVVTGLNGVWRVNGVSNGDCVYYPGSTFTVAGNSDAPSNGLYTVQSAVSSVSYPIFDVLTSGLGGSIRIGGDVTDVFIPGAGPLHKFRITGGAGGGTFTIAAAVFGGTYTVITVDGTENIIPSTSGVATPTPAVTNITVTGTIPLTAASDGTATVPVSIAYPFSSPPTMLTLVAPNTYTIIWHLTGNHAPKFTPGCLVILKDNDVFDNLTSTVVTAVNNGANTDVTVQFRYPTFPAAPNATGTLTHPFPPIPFGFLQYDILTVDSPLQLIGRGSPAYNNDITWGHMLQNNDIHMTEHFRTSDGTPPPAPLTGQLWYDEMTPALQLFASTLYNVVSVITGASGTWTIPGNHAAVPELQPLDGGGNPQKIVIYNDTGSGPGSEVYTIFSVTNNGPNTDIVVTGTIPVTALGDGTLYAFADWHTLAVSGFPVTGDLNMGGYNICNLGVSSAEASEYPMTTVAADCAPSIDFADARYINATDPAGDTMAGVLNMGTNFIQDLASPLLGTDAANKTYVDSLVSGIVWLTPVQDPNLFDDTLGGPDVGTSADITDPFAIYHRTFIVKPQQYTIVSANSGTNTIKIAGNFTSRFLVNQTFVIDGTTSNDGTFTVVSAVNNLGNHDIVVVEAVTTEGAGGFLYHARAGWNGFNLLGAGLISHGHAVVYDPVLVGWKSILTDVSDVERPVAAGDRFGIFMVPDNDDPLTTLPGGSFTGDAAKIYVISSVSTPDYTITWDIPYTPLEPDATSVVGTNSVHFGLSYTFRGTWGIGVFNTNYKWIQFVGPSMIVDGAGLKYTGNILNIDAGLGLTFSAGQLIADTTYLDTLYLTCGLNACAPTFTGLTLSGPLENTGTSHTNIAVGTTAQRPVTPSEGDIRGNSTIASGSFEIYINGMWQTIQTAGKQSIWLPATAWTTRTTNGAASAQVELGTNDIMLNVMDFDQTTSEGIQFMMATPKSWNKGTLSFRPYWTASVGAGTVTWSLAGRTYSDSDPLDAALGTAVDVTDTLLTLEDLHIGPESTAVTLAGSNAENDMAVFQLTRNISDTLTGDARLIGIMLFITYNLPNDN